MSVRRPFFVRLAVVLAASAAFAAMFPAPWTDASLSGAWDKKAYGCVCHSSPANTSVLVDVQGFPPRYDLGGVYPLEIRLVSTPINMTGQWKAGFNAEVSQGAFSVPAALDAVAQAYGNQASHRLNGTALTNWSITWLAPASPSGVVTLWVTVNTVNGPEFEINLIPHTLQVTTLRHLKPGSRVNLEVDLLARYIERLLSASE